MVSTISERKHPVKGVLGVTWQITKLLFIPHQANNYKPHIIRHYGIVLVLATVIGLQVSYNSIKTGDILGQRTEITINSLLEQTNLERQKIGEAPLLLNDKLDQAAYLKAQDMFAKQYWAHNAPDGTPPWKWFGDIGYAYNEAGENLAKNFTTTSAAMTAWMGSPEHRANILDANYVDVGFAIVDGNLNGEPTSLVVALYGAPASSAVMGMNRFSSADPIGRTNILGQFAIAVHSLTPVLLIGIGLIILTMLVALISHTKRQKLPKKLAKSWRRHHGLCKAAGLAVFGLMIIFLSSGGQI